jgi:hypothetical protein
MAGRSKKIRLRQSYVNHIDNNTFSGPMKSGTAPSIGVIKYYWYNYNANCNTNPNAVKKSYDNMVFLNINPAQTPVSAGFRPTTNYNYSYNAPRSIPFYDANVKYDNHYYRGTYLPYGKPKDNQIYVTPSQHMTGFASRQNNVNTAYRIPPENRTGRVFGYNGGSFVYPPKK